MKKTELFTAWHVMDTIDMWVWDRWIDWRLTQAGIPRRNVNHERWSEVVDSVPAHYDWRPRISEGVMHFEWDGGTEDVPLTQFYDDEKDQPDLVMWWHCGYYDGPLSGMAKYNGEWVYFSCIEETDDGDRIFALHELTEEQVKNEIAQYFAFRRDVSDWCDHHPEIMSIPRDESTQKQFEEYYEKAKKWPDNNETSGKVLGKFHWYQFKYWSRPR